MARLRPANVTVFATANDRALSLSSALAQSRQRVGAINPSKPEDRDKIESLGAKVYDLTNFTDGFIDHGAYADAPDGASAPSARRWRRRGPGRDDMSSIDASSYVDPTRCPAGAAARRRAGRPTVAGAPAAADPAAARARRRSPPPRLRRRWPRSESGGRPPPAPLPQPLAPPHI